jgi:hypothetical protein
MMDKVQRTTFTDYKYYCLPSFIHLFLGYRHYEMYLPQEAEEILEKPHEALENKSHI